MKRFQTIVALFATLVVSLSMGAQENAKKEAKQTTKPAYIHISKQDMMLYLCDSLGGHIAEYPMACGKNVGDKQMVGDMKTPEGVFEVQQIQDASSWTHDFKDGKGVIKNAYGPWFIRLLTPGHSGIGIHGTHAPESIGTRATEGCMRLHNENVAKLKPQIRKGLPVIITSSDEDMKVNLSVGIDERTPLYVLVSKESMTLSVCNYKGEAIEQFPIACGTFYGNAERGGDLECRTPEGFFQVESLEGGCARVATTKYKDFGICGSDDKALFEEKGGRTTDGRVVLLEKDYQVLKGYLKVGLKVVITTSETDLRTNRAK